MIKRQFLTQKTVRIAESLKKKELKYSLLPENKIVELELEKLNPANAVTQILTGKAGLFRHYGIVNGIEI